jgi:hypothetical protein
MAKTYVPQAVDEANRLGKYLGRWQIQLLAQADTAEKITALADLAACIARFLAVWVKPPKNP